MKSKEQIEKNIEATFKVIDTIEEVKVNHFFKHKVLQKLENHKEEKSKVFEWFSPQLQIATLGFVLLMNISAFFYAFSSKEQTFDMNMETFAKEYSLQSETTSFLN
jgi:hypothetical protein